MTEDNEQWSKEAAAIVHGELAPAAEKATKSIAKSSVLSALRSGFSSLALAGLGAATGAQLGGGRLVPALGGAATGKALETGKTYVQGSRQRKQGRAILDLVLFFKQSG